MFYPSEVLRRGGRFYLCWVADSWPGRFACTNRRQLQSANIVQLCDDLQEVIVTESGAPGCRFSLRLSTRLLHGLVILYERKAHIMLNDLCMFDANILKFTKMRWEPPHEKRVRRAANARASGAAPARAVATVRGGEAELVLQEAETIEAEKQAMANVVANINDITLKETEIQVRPQNLDNFGEEHPEEVLRQLESMLVDVVPEGARGSQTMELEIPSILDKTVPPMHRPNVSLAVIQHSPTQEEPSTRLNEDITNVEIPSIQAHPAEPATLPQPTEEMELEDLAEAPAAAHRKKRQRRLIVDHTLLIDSATMVERIADCFVDTVEKVEMPARTRSALADSEELARRPARGWRGVATASPALLRLYIRNLAPLGVEPRATRDINELLVKTVNVVIKGLTAPDCIQVYKGVTPAVESSKNSRKTCGRVPPQASITVEPQTTLRSEPTLLQDLPLPDISMLQPDLAFPQDLVLPVEDPETEALYKPPSEAEKENVNPVMEKRPCEDGTPDVVRKRQKVNNNSSITVTTAAAKRKGSNGAESQSEGRRQSLQEQLLGAGLAAPTTPPTAPPAGTPPAARAETPLCSLDRTKVSLGGSVDTTESVSFMKSHWNPHATMLKIITLVQKRVEPLTVPALLRHGPVMPSKRRMVAAHCFTSILKLKQAGFLDVEKNPETQEIANIKFGPRFEPD